MKKTLICMGVIINLSLTGCTLFGSEQEIAYQPKYVPDLFTAEAGTSLKITTEALARKYSLKSIKWHRTISDSYAPLTLPVSLDVKKLTAEQAFDLLYENTPYLTNVDADNNIIFITPFKLNQPNANQYSIIKNQESMAASTSSYSQDTGSFMETDYLNNTNEQPLNTSSPASMDRSYEDELVLKRFEEGENDYKSHTNESSNHIEPYENIGSQSLDNKNYAMNTNMESAEPKKASVFISPSETYAMSIRKYMGGHDLNVMWQVDDKAAELLRNNPTKLIEIKANNPVEFTSALVKELNENLEQPIFAKVDTYTGYVVFHQYEGGENDVSVFEVKKGRLSENVVNLASQFGWSLNMDTGWLANEDYSVSIDYPIITNNNVVAAVLKLTENYPRIKPRFLESKQEVYIINSSDVAK